jgi:methionine synthase II (cobalamin-independent)
MHFEPKWAATCIGSMPDLNVHEICELILALFPDIPFWPQLVKTGPQENMIIQATEGLPCLEVNLKERKVSYKKESDRYEAFALFYENYLSENVEHFAISEGYAAGFYSLLQKIADDPSLPCKYIKGQVAGPVTFGGTVEGSDGKPVLYDPEIMDVIKKGLAMKIVWQAKKIRGLGRTPIVFVDEPYLSGYGSAFVPIQRETVMDTLNETIEEVKKKEETLIGIHCCGNTDWPMILKTNLDIVSLDAYEFADYFVIYPQEIKDFLERGGVVAWGIVPTAKFTGRETVSDLVENLNKAIQALVENGIERETIVKNSLLTPSCGMGLMSVEDSTKALKLLAELSSIASRKT